MKELRAGLTVYNEQTIMLPEEQLIQRIVRAFGRPRSRRRLPVGIGDDTAVFAALHGARWAISTDQFLEGTHFLPSIHPPQMAGYKSLARAASDLAAVGARPRFFLLSLALPARHSDAWLSAFARGMAQAARHLEMTLIGGDTSRLSSGRGVNASLTVLGELAARPMLRSGARPGDAIFLTGTAGAAQLGLTLLLRRQSVRRVPAALLRRHLRPEPRIALGCWLARRKLATAAIDTSDGFSTDLHRLCAASGVGARLEWSLIPAVRIPPGRAYARLDREQIVLHGGEDYELLFTVPGRLAQRLPQVWRGICITPIGRITRSREIRILGSDGSSRLLPARGWDPFADRKLRL